jgi:FMN hydrolase / 5-amino-6-(5-phospho-D-ribitylamino)uracil phosphatase
MLRRPSSAARQALRSASTVRLATPVILFDVMGVIVRDPFYTHMAAYFDMDYKQLLDQKHPSAWVEFERGEISEEEFLTKFFKDGRRFDGEGLVETMKGAYDYIDGMPDLLEKLKETYQLHTFSNYPSWHRHIENKLKLSNYLDWTFISCSGPMKGLRKPQPEAFETAIKYLGRPAEELIFIDDRKENVEAAVCAGMQALHFTGPEELKAALRQRGILAD